MKIRSKTLKYVSNEIKVLFYSFIKPKNQKNNNNPLIFMSLLTFLKCNLRKNEKLKLNRCKTAYKYV